MTYGIFHDLTIEMTVEEVFAAITTPKGLNSWWTKKASGQPKIGEKYQFYFDPEVWNAKVVLCQPDQMICFEMIQTDTDWEGTQLRFTLTAAETGTFLRFEHVGWKGINDHFRRTSYCWAIYLNGLKKYLEKGIVMPYEERSQV